MLNAGVLGAGHLGKIHLKLLNQSSNIIWWAFTMQTPKLPEKLKKNSGIKVSSQWRL